MDSPPKACHTSVVSLLLQLENTVLGPISLVTQAAEAKDVPVFHVASWVSWALGQLSEAFVVWKRSPFPDRSVTAEACAAFRLGADTFLSWCIHTVGVVAGAGTGQVEDVWDWSKLTVVHASTVWIEDIYLRLASNLHITVLSLI